MQIIKNILLICFFLIPAFIANTAYADYPATKVYKADNLPSAWQITYQLNEEDACQKMEQGLAGDTQTYYVYIPNNGSPNTGYCASKFYVNNAFAAQYNIFWYKKCGTQYQNWTVAPVGVCSGNPPTCTAPQVYNPATGNCEAPTCTEGCNGACDSYYKYPSTSYPSSGCIDGCSYKFGDGIQTSDNTSWVILVRNNTGQTCTNPTPTASSGENTPEYDCVQKAQTYGTVNGTVVCVPLGTPNTAPVVKYDSTTGTASSSSTNPDGSPATSTNTTTNTTTQTTYNTDGSVTTTNVTNITNGDGSTSTQETQQTQTKNDYCADNPASSICRQQNICADDPNIPACKHFCEKYPNSLACQNAQDYVGNPSAIPNVANLTTNTINIPSSLPTIAVHSSAQCPAPVVFTAYGTSTTLSFDWLCDYASYFKPLLIAFSLLAAAYIVSGTRRDES